MQIKSTKSDVVWNYIGIVMSMGSNFLLLPFLMRFIDSDFLGLWYVYLSIGGIVTLFDFGFNPTLARNIAYCWSGAAELSSEGVTFSDRKEPNYRLMKKVIGTCKMIYLVISMLALIILLTIGSLYIFHVSKSIFNRAVILSWLLYSIAVFLNLYYGYFATFLRGIGAVSTYNKINVFARLVQIILSIVLLYMGYGIIAVSFAYLIYGFLLRILSKTAFLRHQCLGEQLAKIEENISFEETKQLFFTVWHNAWRDGVVAVANYCANQASTFIASLFLTLADTGIYSISVQLITAIATIAAGLYTAYQPAMQSSYANNNKNNSQKLMAIAMTSFFAIFWGETVVLLVVGIPILKIIKPEYTYDKLVIIGIAIYTFFYKRQSYYASFISNTNRVPYMKSYIVSSTVGVILSVVLVYIFRLGVWGLILGQFIPQIAYNCWKWPEEVFNMLEIKWKDLVILGVTELKKIAKRDKS